MAFRTVVTNMWEDIKIYRCDFWQQKVDNFNSIIFKFALFKIKFKCIKVLKVAQKYGELISGVAPITASLTLLALGLYFSLSQ